MVKGCRLQRGNLVDVGCSVKDLKGAGYICKNLKAAGRSAKNSVDAGCSVQNLRGAGYSWEKLKRK